jgi:polar amino acid transport system substrate-binding protein
MDHNDVTKQSAIASRRTMFAASAGVALAAAAAPAIAQTVAPKPSVLDRILERKKVRFGVNLGFRPVQFRDPSTNQPTGFAIEVAKLLAADLGAEIEWVEMPFGELFAGLAADRFDMTGITVTVTGQRATRVSFSTVPVYLDVNYLLQKKGGTLKSVADANKPDMTVSSIIGGTGVLYAKNLLPKAQLKEVPDKAATFRDVATGRSSATFVAENSLEEAFTAGLDFVEKKVVANAYTTYMVPFGDSRMLHWLDSALQYRHSTADIAQLWDVWLGQGISKLGITSGGVPRDPYRA